MPVLYTCTRGTHSFSVKPFEGSELTALKVDIAQCSIRRLSACFKFKMERAGSGWPGRVGVVGVEGKLTA